MNFILGMIFGIIVATVGFSGIAKVLDSGVNKTKSVVEKIEVDKN
jgi:hypothetical protein